MKRLATAFLCAGFSASPIASAGLYADELSKCLIESTTKEDRVSLVRWMFSAASAHPAVSELVTVTPEMIDAANKVTADLIMKLLTESCRDKARKALSYEGTGTLQTSFSVLGQVAGTELFGDPNVAASMSGLQKYMDSEKLQALTK